MIQVEIIRDASKAYVGFSIKGHAGYAEHGQDIICAAVSVLAQNTVNSIEQFTDDTFSGEIDEKTGSLAVSFPREGFQTIVGLDGTWFDKYCRGVW